MSKRPRRKRGGGFDQTYKDQPYLDLTGNDSYADEAGEAALRPLVRKHAGASADALDAAKGRRRKDLRRILELLRDYSGGLTVHELVRQMGLPIQTVSARLTELHNAERVSWKRCKTCGDRDRDRPRCGACNRTGLERRTVDDHKPSRVYVLGFDPGVDRLPIRRKKKNGTPPTTFGPSAVRILELLARAGGRTVRQCERTLDLAHQSASPSMTRLIAGGLVRRTTEKRGRGRVCVATDRGREYVRQLELERASDAKS